MEEHGEIAERSEVEAEAEAEADTCETNLYTCHHYERDTCLIHFECCPEEVWYACHKCHNEAVGLDENLDEKARENVEPSIEHSDDNYMRTTNILGEMEDSSNQAETSSEHEDPHNDASTGGQVERNKTVKGETSDWPSNNEEGSSEENSAMNHTGLHDDPSTSEKVETNKTVNGEISDEQSNNEEVRREKNASQRPLDAASPSPKENKTKHSVATALDGTRLKCAQCGEKQEFSQYCVKCENFSFATYFCGECKLLIEKKVDPYHCDDCGICRGGKANHFHCLVCKICMALSLKENHKCFADRGHDPCAICFEGVFSGGVIFPCHHMIHEDCAEKLFLSGSNLCPMCRSVIFQEDEGAVIVEETAQQIPSNEETVRSSVCSRFVKKISGAVKLFLERVQTLQNSSGSTEREITEMTERELHNGNCVNTRNITAIN